MSYIAGRLRLCLCFLLAVSAGVCLYLGVSPIFSLRAASADGIHEREPEPGLRLDLRLGAEGVAAALSGTARNIPDPAERVRALSSCLDELEARGAERAADRPAVYYMLWKDTRLVHSPNFPDLAGRNFFGATDADGRAFAREMARNAKEGGGFSVFTPEAGQGPLLAYSLPLADAGGLHVTAHVPAVFAPEAGHVPGPLHSVGFCLTGVSFAGLSALCGMRRKED